MKGLITVLFGISSLAVACGRGGSGGGDGPVTAAQAAEICQVACEHDVACGSTTPVDSCAASCAGDFGGWARKDAVQTIASCRAALACGASDSECSMMVRPLAIHRQWEDRCRVQMQDCVADLDKKCEVDPLAGGDSIFVLVATPIMVEIIDCLDQPDCATRQSCVVSVLSVHDFES